MSPIPGLGAKSWVGFAEESVWGTPITPLTDFYKMAGGETVRWDPVFFDDPSLAGSALWEVLLGTSTVGGDIPFPMRFDGLELILEHLMGDVSTAAAGTGWKHTFTVDDDLPTGLTFGLYRGMPATKQFQLAGCKLTGASFRVERNAPLMLTVGMVGKAEALVTKDTETFTDSMLLIPSQLVVDASDFTGEVDVLSATIDFRQPLTEDRFDLAASGEFKEPQRSDKRMVSITIDGEFSEETQYTDWTGETEGRLVWTWTGPVIGAGPETNELVITAHGKFVARPPQVPDAGPVRMSATFRCFMTDTYDDIKIELTNETATF